MFSTQQTTEPQNQPTLNATYDVIIIGAGPAGATVAALVAEAGHDVLVLDRAAFPRFHVGESLIPETWWTLKRLGLIEQLQQSAFPKKLSVQFVTETGKETMPFYFDEYKDCPSSQTWQIVRSEFDEMMLKNAQKKGATTHTQAQVLDVLFENDAATGVQVQLQENDGTKKTCSIQSKVVVDATGQSAFLANRLKLKTIDNRLRKGSIWSYFQGAHRDKGRDEGATIILQSEEKKSWFWYIPLSNNIVSVGCTGSMDYLFGTKKMSPEEIFSREVERCPGIKQRLESATTVAKHFTTKDFSYSTTEAAGDGWVLVGDAFGFVDPVYSSGVFLALKSGEWAADAIVASLKKNDLSKKSLGCWQKEYREGINLFKKLVYAFYTPDFSFGKFFKEFPQYRSNLVDILIGDVFKPGVGEMFEAMGDLQPPENVPTSFP